MILHKNWLTPSVKSSVFGDSRPPIENKANGTIQYQPHIVTGLIDMIRKKCPYASFHFPTGTLHLPFTTMSLGLVSRYGTAPSMDFFVIPSTEGTAGIIRGSSRLSIMRSGEVPAPIMECPAGYELDMVTALYDDPVVCIEEHGVSVTSPAKFENLDVIDFSVRPTSLRLMRVIMSAIRDADTTCKPSKLVIDVPYDEVDRLAELRFDVFGSLVQLNLLASKAWPMPLLSNVAAGVVSALSLITGALPLLQHLEIPISSPEALGMSVDYPIWKRVPIQVKHLMFGVDSRTLQSIDIALYLSSRCDFTGRVFLGWISEFPRSALYQIVSLDPFMEMLLP